MSFEWDPVKAEANFKKAAEKGWEQRQHKSETMQPTDRGAWIHYFRVGKSQLKTHADHVNFWNKLKGQTTNQSSRSQELARADFYHQRAESMRQSGETEDEIDRMKRMEQKHKQRADSFASVTDREPTVQVPLVLPNYQSKKYVRAGF